MSQQSDQNQLFLTDIIHVQQSISKGLYPTRIAQGSSGSYFCRVQQSNQSEVVGVFKPKDEEPYSDNNPKLVKRIHRTCFPCVYGRSCLGRGVGFLSEASASTVDQLLELGVCPPTVICKLSSPTFHYQNSDRKQIYSSNKQNSYAVQGHKLVESAGVDLEYPFKLPSKIGSFQKFMHGYQNASSFLRLNPYILELDHQNQLDWNLPLPEDDERDILKRAFQLEFEKMVCLDYLIRNTDRGLDNWMIKIGQEVPSADDAKSVEAIKSVFEASIMTGGGVKQADINSVALPSPDSDQSVVSPTVPLQPTIVAEAGSSYKTGTSRRIPTVQIAAIDNGLAFPFKHPDSWRSYPFAWLSLPSAHVPFSTQIRHQMLKLLNDPNWWSGMVKELTEIWQQDFDFDAMKFRMRLAVMKGQAYNLVQVLKRGGALQMEVNDGTSSRSPSPGEKLLVVKKHSPTRSQQTSSPQPHIGTPFELTEMTPCLIWEDQEIRSVEIGSQNRTLSVRRPLFKSW